MLVATLADLAQHGDRHPSIFLAICKRNPASFAIFESTLRSADLRYQKLDSHFAGYALHFLDVLDELTSDMYLIEIFRASCSSRNSS